MILIGMFDSPFVRRVAVSMKLLEIRFEHKNWSVGRDQAQIRKFNPLGRVPVLVLDDGEVLTDSGAILDYLDDRVGADRALLPVTGAPRRRALAFMALATGAAEKAVQQVYEGFFRPEDKRHPPWVARLREQMDGALMVLDRACAGEGDDWLVDEGLSQADITVTCAFTYIDEALKLDPKRYPSLRRHVQRCEKMPAFKSVYAPFEMPAIKT
ncbi:MAG: glutathione S-transferase family protein [Gammaproteobacteria bacterium]